LKVASPSLKSVLSSSAVVFQGWKYGCAPPGMRASFTLEPSLSSTGPVDVPVEASSLAVPAVSLEALVLQPVATSATRASPTTVFRESDCTFMGLTPQRSYRILLS
jgi:hypothetical protein